MPPAAMPRVIQYLLTADNDSAASHTLISQSTPIRIIHAPGDQTDEEKNCNS